MLLEKFWDVEQVLVSIVYCTNQHPVFFTVQHNLSHMAMPLKVHTFFMVLVYSSVCLLPVLLVVSMVACHVAWFPC